MSVQVLDRPALERLVPSAFAKNPFGKVSDRYQFIPTIRIIDRLQDKGFVPVSAVQSRVRNDDRRGFTQHVIRFRLPVDVATKMRKVGDSIPEILLRNSHDRSSGFQLSAGIMKLACTNGLVVSGADFGTISTRHVGKKSTMRTVIDASYEIVDRMPAIMDTVNDWNRVMLTPGQQASFASAALEIHPSSLEIPHMSLLEARRIGDAPERNGERSLWNTMNVIQENTIRGGVRGVSSQNRSRRTRAVTGVDTDIKFNKALWKLTEEMRKLV